MDAWECVCAHACNIFEDVGGCGCVCVCACMCIAIGDIEILCIIQDCGA